MAMFAFEGTVQVSPAAYDGAASATVAVAAASRAATWVRRRRDVLISGLRGSEWRV
jgi:hypothetical protein